MNKIIRLIQNYLIIGLPFVITIMVLQTNHITGKLISTATWIPHYVWTIVGFGMMSWFIMLIIFLITLVTAPRIREKTLRRLANLKERDEREQYITGKASRATYISTLSLMIFFLFFSMFSITLSKQPKPATDGHKYELSMEMGFKLFNNTETPKTNGEQIIFNTHNLSLSTSSIILILLSWQLLAFNINARKEQI